MGGKEGEKTTRTGCKERWPERKRAEKNEEKERGK